MKNTFHAYNSTIYLATEDAKLIGRILNMPEWFRQQEPYGFSFIKKDPYLVFELVNLCKLHGVQFTKYGSKMARIVAGRAAELWKVSKQLDCELDLDQAGLPAGLTLFPHQKVAIKYISLAQKAYLGDTMGLGKTISAIIAAVYNKALPLLYICPSTLTVNVSREVAKWAPGLSCSIVYGQKVGLPAQYGADVVIIGYPILSFHTAALLERNFGGIICDEAHFIKNPKSKRSIAVTKIAKATQIRILMSGTPIENCPEELAAQLEAGGMMKMFSSSYFFKQRYCDPELQFAGRGKKAWNYKGSSNEMELHRKMKCVGYIRRIKEVVFKDHPRVSRHKIFLELDNTKDYLFAKDNIFEHISKEAMKDPKFLEKIADLPVEDRLEAQLTHAKEKVEKAEKAEQLVCVEELRKLIIRGKMIAIKEWVQTFVDAQEKLVVFGIHQEPLEELAAHFDAPLLYGKTKNPQESVDKFQNDKNTFILFANIKTGSLGHTLTAARFLAFIEYDWVPHSQAEARIDRIGQTRDMTMYWLIAENTIEEKIIALLEAKEKVVNLVTDGKKMPKKINIYKDLIVDFINTELNSLKGS